MKTSKFRFLIFPVVALILEILPYGAVLIFATPEETFRKTYSYFSLTPYGYANFGPLFTAILTCVIIGASLFLFFRKKETKNNALKILSVIAVFTSLSPLLYGIEFFSVIGTLISVSLVGNVIILFTDTE